MSSDTGDAPDADGCPGAGAGLVEPDHADLERAVLGEVGVGVQARDLRAAEQDDVAHGRARGVAERAEDGRRDRADARDALHERQQVAEPDGVAEAQPVGMEPARALAGARAQLRQHAVADEVAGEAGLDAEDELDLERDVLGGEHDVLAAGHPQGVDVRRGRGGAGPRRDRPRPRGRRAP